MIVCLCEAVSERQVREVIGSGCQSVKEVGRACGAGTSCGVCCSMVRDLIAEQRGRSSQRKPAG